MESWGGFPRIYVCCFLFSSEMKRKIKVRRQRGANLSLRRVEPGKKETAVLCSSGKSHQPLSHAESCSLVMRAKGMRWRQRRTWGKEEKRAKMLKGVWEDVEKTKQFQGRGREDGSV